MSTTRQAGACGCGAAPAAANVPHAMSTTRPSAGSHRARAFRRRAKAVTFLPGASSHARAWFHFMMLRGAPRQRLDFGPIRKRRARGDSGPVREGVPMERTFLFAAAALTRESSGLLGADRRMREEIQEGLMRPVIRIAAAAGLLAPAAAHASLLSGDTLDTAANVLSWIVI